MNEIALKLAEYLRNTMYRFFIDYNPDSQEKTNFSISHRASANSILEWYFEIATIDWSARKFVLCFTPSATEADKSIITNLINQFDPNK